jgi:hypothetical protein
LRFRDEQRPPKPLYVELAESLGAVIRCRAAPGQYGDWEARHSARIERATKDYMPSGSGFDSGTTIDLDASTADKLVFSTSYHHMNENGFYDGWTDHDIIVTPDLASGFKLRITGRDRNGIKDYIAETFDSALRQPVNRLGLDESTFRCGDGTTHATLAAAKRHAEHVHATTGVVVAIEPAG